MKSPPIAVQIHTNVKVDNKEIDIQTDRAKAICLLSFSPGV